MEDLNTVELRGRIAAPPTVQTFASGTTVTRLLVTVRAGRTDVLPVTFWPGSADAVTTQLDVGDLVHVVGSMQRRFWTDGEARRSRVEVVARNVTIVERSDGSAVPVDEETIDEENLPAGHTWGDCHTFTQEDLHDRSCDAQASA